MRQLLSIRLIAAFAALVAIAWLINVVVVQSDEIERVIAADPPERRVDLVAAIQRTDRTPDFEIGPDGTTTGFIDFTLSGGRVMRIVPGTVLDLECPTLLASNRCAVFADLLGDAVLWAGVRPIEGGDTVVLPQVLDLVDGNAVLDNGWRIPFPPVIERECGTLDIVSFSDFLRRFSEGSTSVVDVTTGQVVAVRCAPDVIAAAEAAADAGDGDGDGSG